MMDLHIITECYVDTKLVKFLVPPSTGYNHQKAVSMVEKTMRSRFNDEFAVGVIDRDKKELGYLEEFESVFCFENDENQPLIELFKHKNKHHYIIIHTNMEKWLLDCAKEVNISLNDFGLPNNIKDLAKITKTATAEKDIDKRFMELFKTISITKSMILLQTWIIYLKNENYQANIGKIVVQSGAIINI